MFSTLWTRRLQYLFLAIIVTTVGFSLYQWNASRASTQKTAPNNGLVGYWSFDENTGTQAGDASGNGNTGTLTNGPTWTTGKLGQAISFDGVDDYVGVMSTTAFDNIFSTGVTLCTWAKFPNFSGYNRLVVIENNAGSDYDIWIQSNQTSGLAQFGAGGGTKYKNSTTALSVNTWYYLCGVTDYTAGGTKIFINGVDDGGSLVGTPTYTADKGDFEIGRIIVSWVPYYGTSSIDEVRIYNRALSGTEITNLYNLGAEKLNVSPVSNLTSGLVGYWTFDGKDTPWSSSSAGTATDRSGNSNTGTLTNMSRTTSPVSGKLGQALNFDGVDDYIATGNYYNVVRGTLSLWVNSTTTLSSVANYHAVYSSLNGGCDVVDMQFDGFSNKWRYVVKGGCVPSTALYSSAIPSNGALQQWHHLVGTWDGSTGTQQLYVDGVLADTTTGGAFTIGNISYTIGGNVYKPWVGSVDEVRIYNRALSAAEVQSLYDLGASDKVNSSVSQNQGIGRLDPGLAGYWKLDDASGTTATDSSTNANSGTLAGGPTWGTGQIGGDVVFDGVNDEINIASPLGIGTGPLTIACWVYLTGNTNGAFVKVGNNVTGTNNGFGIGVGATDFDTSGNNLIGLYEQIAWKLTGVTIGTNAWHHVVMRVNSSGSSTSDYFKDGVLVSSLGASTGTTPTVQTFIGGYTSSALTNRHPAASIDEVRVYNRALSDDEVSQLYRLTAPTGVDTSLKGYWSFDGKATNWTSSSAGTVSDLSGSGNTGTLTNMNRTTSSVSGKLGQALKFDGVDDYVSIPTSSALNFAYNQDFSVTLWAKVPATQIDTGIVGNIIFQKWSGSAGGYPYAIRLFNQTYGTVGDRGKVYALRYDATNLPMVVSGMKINDNTWHHISFTKNGSTLSLYIDGNSSVTTTTDTTTGTTTNAHPLSIGAENGVYFLTGSLDEPRVYNRALSAGEIQSLYNSGR